MLNVQHFTVTFNTKKVQFSSITEEVFNLDARYIIQNVMVKIDLNGIEVRSHIFGIPIILFPSL